MVELNIRSTDFVRDIERTRLSLPSEEQINKALARGVEKTAEEFKDRVQELAPDSDEGNHYDSQYGDLPPQARGREKLNESFRVRSHGSSPFAFEVVTSEDDRAYLLEVGDDGSRPYSAELSQDSDDRNTLAIYAPDHPDANEDGRIFREEAQRDGIDGEFYIKTAFEEFRTQERLERNVQDELEKIV